MEPLRTQGLDHVAITVADLARSRDFYAAILGLRARRAELTEPVFMVDRDGGTGLALFTQDGHPGDGGSGKAPIRVMHFAFRVNRANFDRARAELAAAGVQARYEDHGNVHSLYFPDPDGHAVELACYEVAPGA